jgi:hypothetical protein
MAESGTTGRARIVPDPSRSHRRDPKTGQWSRRDTSSGRFDEAKKQGGTLKSVRRERRRSGASVLLLANSILPPSFLRLR